MLKIASSSIPNSSLGLSSSNGQFFVAYYIVPIILAMQIYNTEQYDRFMLGDFPNPMVDILTKYVEDHSLRFLTSYSERYDSDTKSITTPDGKPLCSLSDRIKDVYSIVFGKSRSLDRQDRSIGDMTFSSLSRYYIEEITSMLSPNADYTFN